MKIFLLIILAGTITTRIKAQNKDTMPEFDRYGKESAYKGNVFNPFFVVAKRWGNNFHSLIYTGPYITKHFDDRVVNTSWQVNTNFHYMIPGTRNFLGIEFNKEAAPGDFDKTIRPQLRLGVCRQLVNWYRNRHPHKKERMKDSAVFSDLYMSLSNKY